MSAKLIAEEGLLKGLVLDLAQGEQWIIGRDPEQCQLLIEDPSASRKHLICRKTPLGILAENLSDTNPLEINHEPVEEPTLLRDGDELRIGDGIFRFHTNNQLDDTQHEPEELEEAQPEETENEEHPSETVQEFSDEDLAPPTEQVLAPNEPVVEEKEHQHLSPTEETRTMKINETKEDHHDTLFEEENEDSYQQQIAEIHFDLTDAGRWLLKVISGPNNGAEFSMKAGTSYVIGNESSTCDIVLQDISVSRQHARLSINEDETIYIEDLGSSNGTIVDHEKITQKSEVPPNTLISLGTTTFAIIDTEGERHTIISPLLPSIANILRQQEEKRAAKAEEQNPPSAAVQEETSQPLLPLEEPAPISAVTQAGNLVFISILTGILLIGGIGITMLFQSNEVTTLKVDMQKEIQEALTHFPGVKYTYNSSTGRLFLGGHVMTTVDRNQILYNLQSFTPKYIKSLDNNLIVDDFIWQEFNQIISRNAAWKGVNIHSPSPERFILTGYLKTRTQADSLSDYMGQNFPYVNLLESKIIVEEDIANEINQLLQEGGLRDIQMSIANGEVSLTGNIATVQTSLYEDILKKIKTIHGIRSIKNYVASLQVDEVLINISDKYTVNGSSNIGGKLSVVINGTILFQGDYLDGMKILEITSSSVLLQKGNVKYRIDY